MSRPNLGVVGFGRGHVQSEPQVGPGRVHAPLGVGHGRIHTQLGCGRGYIQPHLGMGVDASRPNFGLGVDAPRLLIIIIMGSASARCPLPMACNPIKICADHFLPNQPFNAKCTPTKRQLHPSLAAFATLCIKGWTAFILLQFTVLYIYINSNRDTEPF